MDRIPNCVNVPEQSCALSKKFPPQANCVLSCVSQLLVPLEASEIFKKWSLSGGSGH